MIVRSADGNFGGLWFNPQEINMKRLIIIFALTVIPLSAFAAPKSFNIEPKLTTLRFEYTELGFSSHMHLFDKINGKIVVDCEAKTGSVNVTIDAKSVNSGYPLIDDHIQDEDFFDSTNYPFITFKSETLNFDCDKLGEIEGELTVKGVTKPTSMTITSFQTMPDQALNKDLIEANAIAKFKRTDFNMGKYTPYISDEVTLIINLEATKE